MSYQVVGQSTPRVDNTGKVTGEARYTSDVLLAWDSMGEDPAESVLPRAYQAHGYFARGKGAGSARRAQR